MPRLLAGADLHPSQVSRSSPYHPYIYTPFIEASDMSDMSRRTRHGTQSVSPSLKLRVSPEYDVEEQPAKKRALPPHVCKPPRASNFSSSASTILRRNALKCPTRGARATPTPPCGRGLPRRVLLQPDVLTRPQAPHDVRVRPNACSNPLCPPQCRSSSPRCRLVCPNPTTHMRAWRLRRTRSWSGRRWRGELGEALPPPHDETNANERMVWARGKAAVRGRGRDRGVRRGKAAARGEG